MKFIKQQYLKKFSDINGNSQDWACPSDESNIIYAQQTEKSSSDPAKKQVSSAKEPGLRQIEANSIAYVSITKIVELLTAPNTQADQLFESLIYGYQYFISDYQLLQILLQRFCISPLINMSHSERSAYLKKHVHIIQAKVMILVKEWLNEYSEILVAQSQELENTVLEFLFQIYLYAQQPQVI